MDEEFLKATLTALIDGSRPLPPPHPQRLSFPMSEPMIAAVAEIAIELIESGDYKLRPGEVRHLLFKLASWCSKRGLTTGEEVIEQLSYHLNAIDMAIAGRRAWLTSRAGLDWCIRRFAQWSNDMRKRSRASLVEPPVVIDTVVPGYALVELTNACHIHAEGLSVGHCMAWSVNMEVLRKRRYPLGDEALACLTYAIKQRSGELRLFSLRNSERTPMISLAYSPKHHSITTVQPRQQYPREFPFTYSVMLCATVTALTKLVPVESVQALMLCHRKCPKAEWCHGDPPWRNRALKAAEAAERAEALRESYAPLLPDDA